VIAAQKIHGLQSSSLFVKLHHFVIAS
jgi:hypothetical protein